MKFFIGLAVAIILLMTLLHADGAIRPVKARGRGNEIVVVRIEGPITDSEETIRQIKRFSSRDGVAAIILRINSPGGAVGPTQEIYQEILKQRREGMVVVASMGSVAASGGYYIAVAADRIVANPGTITGSIGVIMAFPNVKKLMDKLGVSAEVVKSGKFKDTGSPLKELSAEERKYLQGVIDDVYQQFLEAVARGRNKDRNELKKIANGRIFSGRQAMKLGLVDQLGNLDDAIDQAAKLAKIEGEPKVIMGRRPRGLLYWLLRGSYMKELKNKIIGFHPTLQYIWGY